MIAQVQVPVHNRVSAGVNTSSVLITLFLNTLIPNTWSLLTVLNNLDYYITHIKPLFVETFHFQQNDVYSSAD